MCLILRVGVLHPCTFKYLYYLLFLVILIRGSFGAYIFPVGLYINSPVSSGPVWSGRSWSLTPWWRDTPSFTWAYQTFVCPTKELSELCSMSVCFTSPMVLHAGHFLCFCLYFGSWKFSFPQPGIHFATLAKETFMVIKPFENTFEQVFWIS